MNKKDTYNKTKNKILLESLLKDKASEDKTDKKLEEKKNGTDIN
jgi:hypothetical protein